MSMRLCTAPPINEQTPPIRNSRQYWRWYDVCDYWGNGIFGILPNHDRPIMRIFRPVYVDVSISRHEAAVILWRHRHDKHKPHSDGRVVRTIHKYGRAQVKVR